MSQWTSGDLVVRREINWGQPAIAWPVVVVVDDAELLALFTPPSAPFSYSDAPYPSDTGHHPWWPQTKWEGHGVLMLQRPGDAYAVWHFWSGPNRDFDCWYLNLQDPFRRTPLGIDTEDHELDIVIKPDGTWVYKDAELLESRIRDGRYSFEKGEQIKEQGRQLASMIDEKRTWWDRSWSEWIPPHTWTSPPAVRVDWAEVPWETD